MLSSYFDHRARRTERAENEANAEHRHEETLQAEARREERLEERRRQDAEMAERRHHELMTLLIAALNNSGSQGNGQSELVQSLQRTIETLEAENARLRQQNGNGNSSNVS